MDRTNPITERTKQLVSDLLSNSLNHKELAEELNQRQVYMLSGANWNAGRIELFIAKNQISAATCKH